MRSAVVLLLLSVAAAATAGWWDGLAPPPAGQGIVGQVRCLRVHDGDLYAGGSFLDAGDATVNFVARRTPTGWADLDGGLNNRVDAMANWGGLLICGGRFTDAGGSGANRLAAWNGAAWSPLGGWSGGAVFALAAHDGELWAAGTGFVARWNGSVWQTMTGAAFTADVFALASYDGALYAGGTFDHMIDASGAAITAAHVASWDGVQWSAVGAGCNGTVYALEPWGTALVAGGVFSSPGRLIAAWNGTGWYEPGGGLSGDFVTALDAWSGSLLVGGDFTAGGTTTLTRIARLDGAAWVALGGGLNGMVRAVAGLSNTAWAGGDFAYADTLPSAAVARWNDAVVAVPAATAPARLGLPVPNPFNPRTRIALTLDAPGRVRAAVYDARGRRVAMLADRDWDAGEHVLDWTAEAAAGAYLLRVEIDGRVLTRRLCLVR
jgi:hypothetical protein